MEVRKYVLPMGDYPSVKMKKRATLLHMGEYRGVLCVWARVDPTENECTRRFRLAGTGDTLKPNEYIFVGTVVFHDDEFVFHLFDLGEE